MFPVPFGTFRLIIVSLAVFAQIYLFWRIGRAIRSTHPSGRLTFWAVVLIGAAIGTLFFANWHIMYRPIPWPDPPTLAQAVLFYVPAVWSFGSIFSALLRNHFYTRAAERTARSPPFSAHMMLRAAGGTHAFWKRKIRNLMLPMLDGWEVCRRLRQASEVPVIMLTARAEEVDRGAGLTLGADDYVVKPFSPRELMARVRAVLRRAPLPDPGRKARLSHADVVLDLDKRQLRVAGRWRAPRASAPF
jgi:hypothetical protein